MIKLVPLAIHMHLPCLAKLYHDDYTGMNFVIWHFTSFCFLQCEMAAFDSLKIVFPPATFSKCYESLGGGVLICVQMTSVAFSARVLKEALINLVKQISFNIHFKVRRPIHIIIIWKINSCTPSNFWFVFKKRRKLSITKSMIKIQLNRRVLRKIGASKWGLLLLGLFYVGLCDRRRDFCCFKMDADKTFKGVAHFRSAAVWDRSAPNRSVAGTAKTH